MWLPRTPTPGSRANSFVLLGASLQVEREEVLQDLLVADPLRPAVGGEHGPVEGCVGVRQPRRAGVVEVRECPLLQLRLRRAFRVQPVAPELVQALRCTGDLLPRFLDRLLAPHGSRGGMENLL